MKTICIACGKVFKKRSAQKRCKPCQKAYRKARCASYYQNHREELRVWSAAYYDKNTEAVKARVAAYAEKHKAEIKIKDQKRHKSRYAKHPVYQSVYGHHYKIFSSRRQSDHNYRGMPFCEEWNPDRGGRYEAGEQWIIENLESSRWLLAAYRGPREGVHAGQSGVGVSPEAE